MGFVFYIPKFIHVSQNRNLSTIGYVLYLPTFSLDRRKHYY